MHKVVERVIATADATVAETGRGRGGGVRVGRVLRERAGRGLFTQPSYW